LGIRNGTCCALYTTI